MRRLCVTLLLAALLAGPMTFLAPPCARAQSTAPELRPEDTIRSVLERSAGKRVELVLVSGEKLTGVVARVTAGLVHLEKLGGREFYDALVHVDRIDAIVVRARER